MFRGQCPMHGEYLVKPLCPECEKLATPPAADINRLALVHALADAGLVLGDLGDGRYKIYKGKVKPAQSEVAALAPRQEAPARLSSRQDELRALLVKRIENLLLAEGFFRSTEGDLAEWARQSARALRDCRSMLAALPPPVVRPQPEGDVK